MCEWFEAYILMGQILSVGMLAWVLFKVQELWKKPPILIKCDCFRDIEHDEMVKVKEMYLAMRHQQEEKEKNEKDIDSLAKEG